MRGVSDEQLARLERRYRVPLQRTDEPVEQAVDEDVKYKGVLVALFVPADLAEELAVDGGEAPDELHVTLAYLPGAPEEHALEQLRTIVEELAKTTDPLTGEVSGLGLFKTPDSPVTYASVDLPALPDFRQRVVAALDAARDVLGLEVSRAHGYTPHITLAYADRRELEIPSHPVTFSQITLAAGGERWSFSLRAEVEASKEKDQQPAGYQAETEVIRRNKETPVAQRPHEFRPANWTHPNGHPRCLVCGCEEPVGGQCPGLGSQEHADATKQNWSWVIPGSATASANTLPPAPYLISGAHTLQYFTEPRVEAEPVVLPHLDAQRAFVADVNGKTILTAQADVIRAPEQRINEHFLNLTGRFVGADEPNRNNAFWASADLELGQHTVANGPLNWLHEAKHIVGTIKSAQFKTRDEERAYTFEQPYIEASSVLWKWIYPDEAWVVQAASDAGKLWYSMECISDTVKCAGDNGCGAEAAYMDYLRGINGTCEHMVQRSAVRHFQNPTFLGGAIIVPPVRPGWADADLRAEAAKLAETAALQTDVEMSATEWEQLMAQVITFAR